MALLKKLTSLPFREVRSLCTQVSRQIKPFRNEKHEVVFNAILDTCKTKYADVFARPDSADDKWDEVRKTLIRLGNLTPSITDSMIIDICHSNEYVDAGISYYKFLERSNCRPSIVTIGKYLKLYEAKRTPITEEDKAHILNLYNVIKEKFPAFDYFTANSCVTGLCAIGEWKESIEIIKRFEATERALLLHGYSALIHYLLEHGDAELAYEYLLTCCKRAAGPLSYVYISYLNHCLKEPRTFNEKIERLFNSWAQYGIRPHPVTMKEYMTACNKLGWDARSTTVTFSTCLTCNQKLMEKDLTQEEFKYLAETIKKKLFVGKGYEVTHPQELITFIDFIDRTGPYDVIVDGLNVLLKSKFFHNHDSMNKLLEYYKGMKKKVLVIARRHVAQLVRKQNLTAKAKFFYVNDMSKDDLFMLYAALTSGYHTRIVSEDFMRQHKFALNDVELRVLFKRWQISRQYIHNPNMKKPMNLNQLYGILHGVQKQNNCWHIPLQCSLAESQRIDFIDPNQWCCLKICTPPNE
ncbi:mitochondrial ribonuclease P catalytic subunit isoform X1 [Andrena cerasifolii]|uniref:mitochondrial ribonuclease P catalytic subunit isoform X1 n=1 Tax=Andrena cerasifolii TaxID=2819439 RepID=UPI004037F2D2